MVLMSCTKRRMCAMEPGGKGVSMPNRRTGNGIEAVPYWIGYQKTAANFHWLAA